MKIISLISDETFDQYVAEMITQKISKLNSKEIIIGLSGGNTPKIIYSYLSNYLSSNLFKDYFFDFIIVDERWVEKNSERCNQRMIKNHFNFSQIKNCKLHELLVKDDDISIFSSGEKYEKKITDLLTPNKKIMLILGMGEDGHTASLFPNNQFYLVSLENPKNMVISGLVEEQKESRISLSPNFIKKSDLNVIIIRGFEKGQMLKIATNINDIKKYPILNALTDNSLIFMDDYALEGYDSTE